MGYRIYSRTMDDNEEVLDLLPDSESEFVGAKPIRKHYQSAIRSMLDHHDRVLITVSNTHSRMSFVIEKTD